MRAQFSSPLLGVVGHDAPEAFLVELHSAPVEVVVPRLISERRLHRAGTPSAALDDPFKHAHILAKPGPHEFAIFIDAKPVHVEDARRMLHFVAHGKPVSKVVADVIPAERKHRERIAANFAHLSSRRRSRFGPHRCGFVHAIFPAGGFHDEWDSITAPSTEYKRRYGHAAGIIPFGIKLRALRRFYGEARI